MKVSKTQPPSSLPQPPRMQPSASKSKVTARAPAITSEYQAQEGRERQGPMLEGVFLEFSHHFYLQVINHVGRLGTGVVYLSIATPK